MKKNDETYIQIYLCSFLRKLQLVDKKFIFFHIPNGGKRNKIEAANLKLAGVLPGVPDLCIISKDHHQFIEMKIGDGSLSKVQSDFIEDVKQYNWIVNVIYADNPKEAIEQISPLMEKIGYSQKEIYEASSSVIDSVK